MESKNAGARESKPVIVPPPSAGLLEDDEESVTGVVNVAHQSAEVRSKDVDAERDKITQRMQTLREKLSNSGPIAKRPRKKELSRP